MTDSHAVNAKIHPLIEELEVAAIVLRQQASVLEMFKDALNPATYRVRELQRAMEHDARERPTIDAMLKKVRRDAASVDDLVRIAKGLAQENIALGHHAALHDIKRALAHVFG